MTTLLFFQQKHKTPPQSLLCLCAYTALPFPLITFMFYQLLEFDSQLKKGRTNGGKNYERTEKRAVMTINLLIEQSIAFHFNKPKTFLHHKTFLL